MFRPLGRSPAVLHDPSGLYCRPWDEVAGGQGAGRGI